METLDERGIAIPTKNRLLHCRLPKNLRGMNGGDSLAGGIVTNVHDDGKVNLHVFLDGPVHRWMERIEFVEEDPGEEFDGAMPVAFWPQRV